MSPIEQQFLAHEDARKPREGVGQVLRQVADNPDLDRTFTQAVAAELALRFALAAGAELNQVAHEIAHQAEITRRQSRWESQADADDFDLRR
jgi:hypothetical protein